jgi:hypothetical protein
MHVNIEKTDLGYSIKLFDGDSFIGVVAINDFEFNVDGHIESKNHSKYFCGLKSEKRLEFASIQTELGVVEFFDVWKRTCLHLSSSGIVLPFIEFICEGIDFFQTDSNSYQINLINCFSRTTQIEDTFEKRDKVLFFEKRTFAEIFFNVDAKVSWFHGYFYSKVGKEFTHNRLRLKVINFLRLQCHDYTGFKDRSKRGRP